MLHGDLEAPEYETHRRVGETDAKSTAYVLANLLDYDVDVLVARLCPDSIAAAEYLSILTSIRNLPPRDAQVREWQEERAREKEVIKRRLATLADSSEMLPENVATSKSSRVFGCPSIPELRKAIIRTWRVTGATSTFSRCC